MIDDAISDLDSLIRRVRSLILDLTHAGRRQGGNQANSPQPTRQSLLPKSKP